MENTMINYKRFTPYPNKREILNIPVAFHVNYHAKIQNIPDCLSQNQIQQFYLDFFKQNKNTIETRKLFIDIASDVNNER